MAVSLACLTVLMAGLSLYLSAGACADSDAHDRPRAGLSAVADSGKLERRGKVILQENCARCHAIEARGDSPLKIAPPMRDIYARFAPQELRAEIMHGMVSRHKEMPQIDFSEEDTAAILAYLYALAVGK
jgi:mono/diheme cytochrome c family protein